MKYTLSLTLLCLTIFCHAQVRHVKGIKSIEAGGGLTKFGTAFYAGYVNYFNSKLYGKYNLFYEHGGNVALRYRSIGADISACYSLPPVKEFLYFNLRAGVTASNDQMHPPLLVFDDDGVARTENYSVIKFGIFAGGETEIFLNDQLVFVIGANQRLMFKNEFGNYRFFLTAGVRYNL